jgi:probable HAF family extracellular repeat protein
VRRFSYTSAWTLCGILALISPASSQTYTVTDLGTFPGGTTSNALAIDHAGQVTGWANGTYRSGGPTFTYAFIYRNGNLKSIGSLGGNSSVGYGIAASVDDKEQRALITGAANTGSGSTHAFFYKDGFLSDIGLLPGGTYSQGNAINRSGHIAGEADASNGIVNSFLYKHGTMIELPALGGEGGLAFGINDADDVTGTAGTPNNESDAFLYCDGHTQDLGKLPLPRGKLLDRESHQ